MLRTLLIVDDNDINRRVLKKTLSADYNILEAAGGAQALTVMREHGKTLSAVLLDIVMPDMDGYEVLRRMRDDALLAPIPVIMVTGSEDEAARVKALSFGANDFIQKPFSPEIMKHCLRNNIALRETASTLKAAQRDKLTGLYNRDAFFDKVSEAVAAHEAGYYVMACFDVDKFKVVNDQYGTEKGDDVLRYIANVFNRNFTPNGGICCRVTADNFAVLYPVTFSDTVEIESIREQASRVEGMVLPIIFTIGRYIVDDKTLSPAAMYDRAVLAADTIKGRYDTSIAVYSEDMREKLLHEQEIVNEMEDALNGHQFEVWYQPQYNHSTDAMIGAEALVRWRHPQKGMISPGAFIPVFEQNGFIYQLDKYVWEETCRALRKWTDEGRRPLPVSVNISRYDVLRPDLIEVISGLIEKYALPIDMLRLEVTESAFTDSFQPIVEVVRELVARGFTVEIDDFGSGYSSLNTLKDVPAQIIKLDMKFLQNSADTQRGGNIVESVVRMAKWLGMAVIAEGVETVAQADYLRSIGCSYMQGFLFARPMPAAQYEIHCRDSEKEERLLTLETVENLNNNSFWDPASMDTLIFNSYVGGACIFEYHQGKIELIRATEKYAQVIGSAGMTVEEALRLDWSDHLDKDNARDVLACIEESIKTRREVACEFLFHNLPGCPPETYLRSTLRVIASAGSRYLVYCTNENITAQRRSEDRERRAHNQLQTIMENVDLGIIAALLKDGEAQYLYANDHYYEMLGYTREQFEREVVSPYDTVAPEDVARVREETLKVDHPGASTVLEYNALTRTGGRRFLRAVISIGSMLGIEKPAQISIIRDITDEMETEQREKRANEQIKTMMDDMPGGFARLRVAPDGSLHHVYINRGMSALTGIPHDDMMTMYEKDALCAVHPDDLPVVREVINKMLENGEAHSSRYRLIRKDGSYVWVNIFGRVTNDVSGERYLSIYYSDASEQITYQQMLPLLLSAIMDSTSDYAFAKDMNFRYISASRAFANMVGLAEAADVLGKTDFDLFDKELAEKFRTDDEKLFADGKAMIDMPESIPSGTDAPRYAITSKYLLRDGAGATVGLYGVGRDVTKAVSQDSQLKLVNDSIPGGLATYVCKANDFKPEHIKIAYFNDGFCRLFGLTREEYMKVSAQDVMSMVFASDHALLVEQWLTLMKNNTPINCLYRAHVRGGGYKWISHRAVAADRSGGRVVINAILQDVTDQRELIEQLRISEEESNLAVRLGGNIICRFSVAERSLSVSPDVAASFSLPEKITGVPHEPVRLGMISPESADAYIGFFEAILHGAKAATATFQQKYCGEWRWMEAKSSTIFADDGAPVKAVISLLDVTERLERETIYRKWQQSLDDRPPESYTLFRCNLNNDTAFATVEGTLLTFDFHAAGANFNERARTYVAQMVCEEDRDRYAACVNSDIMLANYYRGKRSDKLEFREKLPDGDTRWLRLTIDLVEYPNSTEVEAYLMYEDIDEAKRAELQTKTLSETDPLTGVLNRIAFAARVEDIIHASAPDARHALLMLDVDGFKQVNDVFGHGAGDQALYDIATSLRAIMRRGDLVARLGGDEFLVFLNDIRDEKSAAAKARQIGTLVRRAFSMEVQISGSIGIAFVPRDGVDFETLYKKADAALYYVKGSGKDNYVFYTENMADQVLLPDPDFMGFTQEKTEKKRRMLIVDDNAIDHEMLQNIFRENYIIEKAKEGGSALIRLRHYGSAISVVLLDLMMPGIDGFTVLEKMQASAELQSIPVIIVSGDESRETCLEAIRKGATDFITKPVDADLLRIRVQSAVSKAENERLRAKNILLETQNEERLRYESALESSGITFIEYNWHTGAFNYHPSIVNYLWGVYDGRSFWQILLSDMVADTQTVQDMQQLVHHIAEDRVQMTASKLVRLKTRKRVTHTFRMNIRKIVNEYQLTNKLFISLNDLDYDARV